MALTTDFIAAVRRQGSIPSTYASTDILSIGDGEVQAVFVPLLEELRANYFVREVTTGVDARGRIPIPARAIGATLRSVQLVINGSWVSLPQRAMEDPDYTGSGYPAAYYLDAGSICLLPTGSAGTLRIRYTARPGRMVLDTDLSSAAPITFSLQGTTTTAITSGLTGGPAYVDVVSGGPAHQAKAVFAPLSGGAIPNTSLAEEIATITGGYLDYLTIPNVSPFVPLPEELYAALVHRTAGVILRSLAYLEESAAQLEIASEAIERSKGMLMPRNEGNPPRITGGIRAALGGRILGRFR